MLCRCHSTVCGLMNSRAPISGFERPQGQLGQPGELLAGLARREHQRRAGVPATPIRTAALSALPEPRSASSGWPSPQRRRYTRPSDLQLDLARNVGALSMLPLALSTRVGVLVHVGDLAAASALIEELETVTEAMGSRVTPYGALALAAWQGREAEASRLIDTVGREVAARGEGMGVTVVNWASAVLWNGHARYDAALAAAQRGGAHPDELGPTAGALTELVEAAARSGCRDLAADALAQLSEPTRASGTDWALGVDARSRALLSEGRAAEELYREATDRLGRTRLRPALARAHLLYGEWLRQEHRRADAREELRRAHELLAEMGIEAFAERARRELLATGERARRPVVATRVELTAHEAQIARLAADGLSNSAIGARLFISPRTVEWHLRNVFARLGIAARTHLRGALADDAHEAQPV